MHNNGIHRLIYLNESLVQGVALLGLQGLGGVTTLEKMCHWGWVHFEISKPHAKPRVSLSLPTA